MKDFFISYNKADREVAAWIDQQLRAAGYSTTFQLTDMPPGSAFVNEMDKAIEENAGLIAVLSPDYLKAPHCKAEWQAFYQKDPNGEHRALILVHVRKCEPKGLLAQRVYIDLVGKTGEEAKRILLAGIKAAREKLELPARYPLDDLLNRYFNQLRQKVSTVRIFGDAGSHPLDQVFVELSINEEYDRRPNQAEFLGLMDAELRRMRSVFGDAEQYREGADDVDQRAFAKTKRTIKPDDLLHHHTHAVVTGAPGCGKTTLLRYLTWQTLKAWRDAFVVPPSGSATQAQPPEGGTTNARFPVFIELKQLTATAFQQAQGQLEELLFAVGIAATLKPGQAESETLKDYFFNLLRAGRVAIFLDGLDEVSGASFFRELQKDTQAFLHSVYAVNTVIISTRPFALTHFADAKEMEILPLNPRQIEQFIAHYYRDVPERQQFQRELQRRRELRELARVPALLGFILQLWRKHGSVTDGKLELYEQITHELAQQLDREKEGVAPDREWLVPDKDGSLKLDLLRQLAFNQLFNGLIHPPYEVGGSTNDVDRLVFTSEQLRAQAAAFARTLKEREGLIINPRNLAEDVKATALLRQVGTDHYAFAHLTLQEYLAAWQLAKRDNGDTSERIFCRAYFNPMLAEMEVLPMVLGLVNEPDKLYEVLEQLPESLSLAGLRLRARGLGYAAVSRQTLKLMVDRLDVFISLNVEDMRCYHAAVLKAYAYASGKDLDEILKHIAQSLEADRSDYERECAVEALSLFHFEEAAALLQKALSDPNAEVRIRAAASLSWHDLDSSISILKKELGNTDERIKENIVYTAWQLIGESATEVLIEALNDESASVRSQAIEALGSIGGEKAVSGLVNHLQVGRTDDAENIVDALGNIGNKGVLNILFQHLGQPTCQAKRQIIRTLGQIGDSCAVPYLLSVVEGKKTDCRIEAVEALGRIPSKEQIEPLRKLLDETRKGWLKNLNAKFYILSTYPETLLIKTTSSLLKLDDETGVPVLLDVLERGDDYLKAEAVRALEELDDAAIRAALLKAWEKTKAQYEKVRQQTKVVSSKPELLANLANALTKLGEVQVISALVEWLDDPQFFCSSLVMQSPSAAVINALGRGKGKEATEGFIKIFQKGGLFSQPGALLVLGNIQDKYSVAGLLRGFLISQRFIQARTVSRILSMDDETISEGLALAFFDTNKRVRRKAVEFIPYYSKDLSLIERLRAFATNDSSLRAKLSAIHSLGSFECKLQHFDIPIPTTPTNDYSPHSPPPLLTAQERAELETRIAAEYQEVLHSNDARQKGKALEELLATLFAGIPGFTVNERNYHTATEELDLVLRNASADPFWRELGSLILVEAKHWQAQRVGKNEYVQFYRKLEARGGHCTLGFLVCTERFAETFHLEALRDSKDRLRVVPIDGDDLQRLVEAEDRSTILRSFVERAVLQ
jgi:HEAT repeat protein